jgi:hypothetical protein
VHDFASHGLVLEWFTGGAIARNLNHAAKATLSVKLEGLLAASGEKQIV